MDIIIVDIQGFKDSENRFIVKELAIATGEYTQVFLIKPPYSFNYLTNEEKKQVSWIERNRGIFWNEGFINYRGFKQVIVPYLENKNILVKGLEKVDWIKKLSSNCNVVDVGDKGCPNFFKLHNNYCKKGIFNCVNHNKQCALKNVISIKKWYYDNNINYFSLFGRDVCGTGKEKNVTYIDSVG